jgi:hypothetical protein
MKNQLCIFVVISLIILTNSCTDSGTTSLKLNGTEEKLPDELKGLKIYNVVVDNSDIKVAILDEKINSLYSSRRVGKRKIDNNVIIVHHIEEGKRPRSIEVTSVLFEDDSIVLCRKKWKNH